jgi:hypothetical protein
MKAFREYCRGATSAAHGSHRFLLTKRTQGTRTATRFAIGRAATAWKLALVVAGALALTIAASGGASAAAPVDNVHGVSTSTSADQLCGIDGTSTFTTVVNIKVFADNTVLDNTLNRQVFTAGNGKSVEILAAGQVSGSNDPIQNADGTVTFITTFTGLVEKLSIAGGPTLSRDAGTATLADTFLPLPDGSLQFVSETVSGVNGPHPELASDFELFCNVLIPALT